MANRQDESRSVLLSAATCYHLQLSKAVCPLNNFQQHSKGREAECYDDQISEAQVSWQGLDMALTLSQFSMSSLHPKPLRQPQYLLLPVTWSHPSSPLQVATQPQRQILLIHAAKISKDEYH